MKKANSICILVGIIFIFSISCASNTKRSSQGKDAIMFGMLYDHENNPVKGVSVSIDGNHMGESDVLGRFTLVDLRPGEYTLTLEKAGYERIEDSFVFDPLSMLYYRMITASQLIIEAERALAGFDYPAAREMLDRALQLEPFRYDAVYLQAIAYYCEKNYENAIKMLDRLRELGYTSIYAEKLKHEIVDRMK